MDACPVDLRPMLCLLRRGRLWLLLPCLPERGGVVLPPVGLEEPHSHTRPKASPEDPGEKWHMVGNNFQAPRQNTSPQAQPGATVYSRTEECAVPSHVLGGVSKEKGRWGTVVAVCTVHGSKRVSQLATKRDLVFNLSLLLSQRESIPTLPPVHSVPKEAEAGPGALWSLSAAMGSALIARLRSPRPAQRLWLCLIVDFLRASSSQLCRSSAYCFICFWKISKGFFRWFENNCMAAASAPYAFRFSAPPAQFLHRWIITCRYFTVIGWSYRQDLLTNKARWTLNVQSSLRPTEKETQPGMPVY